MTMMFQTDEALTSPACVPLTRVQPVHSRPSIDIETMRAAWQVTEHFFGALQRHDVDALVRFYAHEAEFFHPLLGRLTQLQVSAAWRRFVQLTPDLSVRFRIEQVGPGAAEASWTQSYLFHLTGRRVSVSGTSQFLLGRQGGRLQIIKQIDQCDRRQWSRQALGMKGLLLSFVPGWRTFVENELRLTLDVPHHAG